MRRRQCVVLFASLPLVLALAAPAWAASKQEGDSNLKNQKLDLKQVSEPVPLKKQKVQKSEDKKTGKPEISPLKKDKPSLSDSSSSGSSASSGSGSGALTVPPPSHVVRPPDMEIIHQDNDLKRVREVFDLAPPRRLLDDPDGLPFDEEFGRNARVEEPGNAPLPDGVDPSRIPGRGDGRASFDEVRPPDERDYDMNDPEDREIYGRKWAEYGRAFLEGDVWDFDLGLVYDITYEQWMAEHERYSHGQEFAKDVLNPDPEANTTYEQLYIQDEDEQKGTDKDKLDKIIADDGGEPPVKKDPTKGEGTDPDELRAIFSAGSVGGSSRGAGIGQFAPPRDPEKEEYQRQHARRTRGGGPDPDDRGEGPDKNTIESTLGSILDMPDSGAAASPSIGEGGEGSPTPPGPRYTPVAGGDLALPSMGEAASPSVGDEGKGGGVTPPGPEF